MTSREANQKERGKENWGWKKHERRFLIIGFCILLMASAIYIVGESLGASVYGDPKSGNIVTPGSPSRLVQEVSGFERGAVALSYLRASQEGDRSLDVFVSRRAYPGGPPIIPHPVANERSMGGTVCLTCHANGGYVPKFNAFAPVTPHPTLPNCRQCHNPARTDELFAETTFRSAAVPQLNRQALPTSPPPIPHPLEMRSNCLACHAGPGAVAEIRTTHPDRVNCRQCHALATDGMVWERPVGDRLP